MTEITYLPIEGVEGSVASRTVRAFTRNDNFFNILKYAKNNNLIILPSQEVNAVARALSPKEPKKTFMKYAKQYSEMNSKQIIFHYGELREDVFGANNYGTNSIKTTDILIWKSINSIHPRIIDNVEREEFKSFLCSKYEIIDDKYIDIKGCEAPVEVDWPMVESGGSQETKEITKKLAEMLNAENNTRIWQEIPSEDIFYFDEGIRLLEWSYDHYHHGSTLSAGSSPWATIWDIVHKKGFLLKEKK